jgi:hypothetical protein
MAHLVEVSGRLGRRIVFGLDDRLRRLEGIFAFNQDPSCVIRISRSVSRSEQVLADETLIRVGDPLIELHWWNEHIARLASTGSSLQWGLQFYRYTYYSLLALARYVDESPDLREIVALHGATTFPDEVSYQHHANAFRRLGFELVPHPPPTRADELLLHSLRRFHVWALTWASNPASLRHRGPCAIVRCDLWISRQTLLERCASHESPLLAGNGPGGQSPPWNPPDETFPRPIHQELLSGHRDRRGRSQGPAAAPGSDPWALLRARLRGHYTSWKR